MLLLVDLFNDLEAIFLGKTGRYHALFQLLERTLFFVLEHLESLDQGFFGGLELLRFLLVLVDEALLLLCALLLVRLAYADFVHREIMDILATLRGQLSNVFTLGRLGFELLLLEVALAVKLLVEFVAYRLDARALIHVHV